MKQELSSVDCLRDCFKDVESLTIIRQRESARIESEEVISCAPDLKLLAANPKLTSLTINDDNIIDIITPALTANGGLKELTLNTNVSPDFQKLAEMTEHQPLLHSVSLSVTCLFFDPVSIYTPRKGSKTHFISWLQACFRNPSLQDLKLKLNTSSPELPLQAVIVFLSTPCSHQQTLTLQILGEYASKAIEPSPKPPAPLHKPLKNTTLLSIPSDVPTSRVHQFDNACNLKYKCLTFDFCSVHASFTKAFLTLAPLMLKHISLNGVSLIATEFFSQLAQEPLIEMELLEVTSVLRDHQSTTDLDSLLRKKCLKSASIKYYSYDSFPVLSDVALCRGFEMKTNFNTSTKEVTYIFTKIV